MDRMGMAKLVKRAVSMMKGPAKVSTILAKIAKRKAVKVKEIQASHAT